MLIIDRIEGDIAVVETENGHINVSLSAISGKPKEGDVLKKGDQGYVIDKAETASRKRKIFSLQSSLFKK